MSEVKVGDEDDKHYSCHLWFRFNNYFGETQILGQIRDAFFLAQSTGTTQEQFLIIYLNRQLLLQKEHIMKQI